MAQAVVFIGISHLPSGARTTAAVKRRFPGERPAGTLEKLHSVAKRQRIVTRSAYPIGPGPAHRGDAGFDQGL